jgi:hypothetical protein
LDWSVSIQSSADKIQSSIHFSFEDEKFAWIGSMLDHTIHMISAMRWFVCVWCICEIVKRQVFTFVVGVWDTQCLRLFVCVWFGDALDIARAITKLGKSDFS